MLTQELVLSFFSSTHRTAELRQHALALKVANIEEFIKVVAVFNLNCFGE
jgi:hypothetical protein